MSKLSRRMKRLLAIVLVEAVVAVNVLTSFAHEAGEPYTMSAEKADEEAGDGAETSQDSGGSDYDDSGSQDSYDSSDSGSSNVVSEVVVASAEDETQTELTDADSEEGDLGEAELDEADLVPALTPTDTTGEAGETPESEEVIDGEASEEDEVLTTEDEAIDDADAELEEEDADAQDDDNESEASDETVTDEEDSVEVADADAVTDESEETEAEDDTAVTVAGEDGIVIDAEDVTETNGGVYEIDNTLYQNIAASGMGIFKVLSAEQLQQLTQDDEKINEQVATIADDIEENMKNSSGQSLSDEQKKALQDFLKSVSKSSNFAAYTDTLYTNMHTDGNLAANDVRSGHTEWVQEGKWVEKEITEWTQGYLDEETNQWIPGEEIVVGYETVWVEEWVEKIVDDGEGRLNFGDNTNMGDGFTYVGNSGNVHPDKGTLEDDMSGNQIVGSIVVGGSATVDNGDGDNKVGIDVFNIEDIPTDPEKLEEFLKEHPELAGLENVKDIEGNLREMAKTGSDLINAMTSSDETVDKESSEAMLRELAKPENMDQLSSDDIIVANISVDTLTNPSNDMNNDQVLLNLIKNNVHGATIVINIVDAKQLERLSVMLEVDRDTGDFFPEWGDMAQYVVWNFGDYEGTISLDKSFGGVIVAPNATVMVNSTIGAGRVVADTIYQGGGEMHGATDSRVTPTPEVPGPSSTPEPTESPEPTAEPTATPTVEPTATPTAEPTATPTAEPTATPTAEPTATPTAEPTATPTAEPTATPTAEPTATPTAEPTATPTAEPTATPTAEPTATPTAEPTATPTAEPTATPTAEPTATPTAEPTATPTAEPTATPTAEPTATPTAEPTATPTAEPTATPTVEPTATPTAEPTATPELTESPTPDVTPTPENEEPTPTPDVTPEPTPGETPGPTPDTPGDEPGPTPDTPGGEPEPTPYVVDEPTPVPVVAPTPAGQVLGARRTQIGGTEGAVLGARRGSDFAVLGKRRRPSTGDSIAMVMWILAMMAAAGGAIISLVMMRHNKKKGE